MLTLNGITKGENPLAEFEAEPQNAQDDYKMSNGMQAVVCIDINLIFCKHFLITWFRRQSLLQSPKSAPFG